MVFADYKCRRYDYKCHRYDYKCHRYDYEGRRYDYECRSYTATNGADMTTNVAVIMLQLSQLTTNVAAYNATNVADDYECPDVYAYGCRMRGIPKWKI